MKLILLEFEYSICKLSPTDQIPEWAKSPFTSITFTNDELSIVTRSTEIPNGVKREEGWKIFQVDGKLEFDLVGVIAGISVALSNANVPIFVVSTFNTDYFMVKSRDLDTAIRALQRAGYTL